MKIIIRPFAGVVLEKKAKDSFIILFFEDSDTFLTIQNMDHVFDNNTCIKIG